jgi:EF-hand domain pair/EF hand
MMVNSDHVMTRDEVVQHVQKLFAKLDANHDGFITKEEVESFRQKMAGATGMAHEMAGRFAGHGRPDRGAMFDKLDTNHDGMISRQEYMAARPEVQERRILVMREGGGPEAPGAPTAPGAPGDPEMHRMMEMHLHGAAMHMGGLGGHLFEMADANHDGRVSLQEAETAALAHFDKADLNHDGKITPDEREQAHALHREHHPS